MMKHLSISHSDAAYIVGSIGLLLTNPHIRFPADTDREALQALLVRLAAPLDLSDSLKAVIEKVLGDSTTSQAAAAPSITGNAIAKMLIIMLARLRHASTQLSIALHDLEKDNPNAAVGALYGLDAVFQELSSLHAAIVAMHKNRHYGDAQ